MRVPYRSAEEVLMGYLAENPRVKAENVVYRKGRVVADLWRTDDDYNVWSTTQHFYEELGSLAVTFNLSKVLAEMEEQ